jgi:hypothetical protein
MGTVLEDALALVSGYFQKNSPMTRFLTGFAEYKTGASQPVDGSATVRL